jgi:hypothetical protein
MRVESQVADHLRQAEPAVRGARQQEMTARLQPSDPRERAVPVVATVIMAGAVTALSGHHLLLQILGGAAAYAVAASALGWPRLSAILKRIKARKDRA